MFKRVFLSILFCSLVYVSNAQEQTDFQIDKDTPILKAKHRNEPSPKFLIINYSWIETTNTSFSPNANSDEVTNHLTYQDLDTYLKFPIFVKKDLQIVGGVEYGIKNIHIDEKGMSEATLLSNLHNKNFHRAGGELLMRLNLNQRNYLYGYSAASLNYDKFASTNIHKQLNGLASLLHGHRRSPDTDLGYGIGVAYTSGRYVPFPILLYSHYFTSKFKLTVLIPNNIEARYSPSHNAHLYFLAKPSGTSYLVNENISDTYNQLIFNKSDLQISTSIEREIHKWFWIRLRGGYNIPVNYSFSNVESTENEMDIGIDVSAFGFATVTLFTVVPDKILKKAKSR